MTEKQIAFLKEIEAELASHSLQVEQLSEDVRGLMYTVQDLVSVIEEAGISSMSSKLHRLKKVAI